MRRSAFSIILIVLAVAGSWSQTSSSGGKKVVTVLLTINVNVPNAIITVDGQAVKENIAQVTSGSHLVRVEAIGYIPFEQTVTLSRAQTINVTLQPQLVQLSILTNVKGALIAVDGAAIKANPLMVMPGSHTVTVQAVGYIPYQETVSVLGPMTVNAVLQPAMAGLTIVYAQADVIVFVDGVQLLAPKAVNVDGTVQQSTVLPLGEHTIMIQSQYYLPYQQKINLTGDMTVRPALQAQLFELQVLSSVKGAAVTVNGKTAVSPMKLPAGEYLVGVSAAGCQPFEQKVALFQNTRVDAILQPALFDLNIQCDVPGAVMMIGETLISALPEKVPAGTYRITVMAPGYADFTQMVKVAGNTIVPVTMKMLPSMAVIVPPESAINKNAKGNHFGLMELWIDGIQMKLNKDRLEVPSGKHLVRFVTGGLWTEVELIFEPGVTYTLEPQISLKAIPVYQPGQLKQLGAPNQLNQTGNTKKQ